MRCNLDGIKIIESQSVPENMAILVSTDNAGNLKDIASRDYEAEIYLLKAEIKRLEAENEALKCCGNCSHLGLENKHILFCDNDMYPFPITGKCDKWEDRK
jgi:hypothetical protein